METQTVVIFRKWYNGEIIALFPAIPFDVFGRYCTSYEHVGQHGGADYSGVIARTSAATSAEYEPLQRELTSIGYVLAVRKRYTRRK